MTYNLHSFLGNGVTNHPHYFDLSITFIISLQCICLGVVLYYGFMCVSDEGAEAEMKLNNK